MDEYFSRTLVISNRMTAHEEKLEQVVVVEEILRSILVRFNYVVCSFEESNDMTTLLDGDFQSTESVTKNSWNNKH